MPGLSNKCVSSVTHLKKMGRLIPDCPGQRALKPSCFICLALMTLYIEYAVGFSIAREIWICGSRAGNAGCAMGMKALAGIKWKKWWLWCSPGILVETWERTVVFLTSGEHPSHWATIRLEWWGGERMEMGLQLSVHPVETGLLNRRYANHFDPKRESVESKQTTTKKVNAA